MRKMVALLCFGLLGSLLGCKEKPVPPPKNESREASQVKNDAPATQSEGRLKESPATAKVQLVVSTEFSWDSLPKETTTISFKQTTRIWIYAFWQGLRPGKRYQATFMICEPDKADVCDNPWILAPKFTTSNTPTGSRDIVYVEPYGWMLKVGFDLVLSDEPLGVWTIYVHLTGESDPSDKRLITVM